LVLILGGGLFLALNLGYVVSMSPVFWIAVFAGLGVLFLVTYFLNGVQHWGWLFPALIFSSIALTIRLSEAGVEGNLVAAPILLGVAVPFLVAFAFDPRKRWWALIPAWVMVVNTSLVLFSDQVQGELVGSMVLFSIALPFLVVFLWSRRNWWALIPAGILTSIGPGLLLLGSGPEIEQRANLMNGLMFFGWAATFGVLWLMRHSFPTAWAKYPAVVMAVVGLVMLTVGANNQILWPLLLVAAGVVVLAVSLLPKRAQ
jgi:peptidoglycan/LPS O-acetylase OafA/YrhL